MIYNGGAKWLALEYHQVSRLQAEIKQIISEAPVVGGKKSHSKFLFGALKGAKRRLYCD